MSVTIDGITYTANMDGVTAYVSGRGGLLIFPDSIIQSPVTIGMTSYQVTSIGTNAFISSLVLTSITIPDSVIIIGQSAFQSCNNLTTVTFSPASLLNDILDQAFLECTALSSVTIPASVTNIGESAFGLCINLISISIPESVTIISNSLFEGCKRLASITIPETVTDIGIGAFYQCETLSSVTIPASVTNIGESAFGFCISLISISIFASVTIISNSLFEGCTSLASITIPVSVTDIGIRAFYQCETLSSVTIPASVTNIGESAFGFCVTLSTVTFNGSTITIDLTSFDNISATAVAYAPTINDYLEPLTGFSQKSSYPSLITDISPPIGDVNIPVTITGSGFTFTDSIAFGDVNALFEIVDDTSIIATSPMQDALGAYVVTVNVTNATGIYSPTGEYIYNALCLNHDTKILIWTETGDKYVAIQYLRKGDIVKSYAHGYRKIECIGKNKLINNPKMWLQSMWKMEKSDKNELIDDLYMLGGHSLLVDSLSEEVKSKYKEYNCFSGGSPTIDGKLLLCAGLSGICSQLDNIDTYTFYQLTLDNDGDDDKRFGIWANGVLVETPSKTQFNCINWKDMNV